MLRLVVIASLLVGCRITLENEEELAGMFPRCTDNMTAPACVNATTHSELSWLQTNVFVSCTFGGCHDGSNAPDLRSGRSHAALVDTPSTIEPTRTLVVPNDIQSSYLMFMLGFYAGGDATPPATLPEVGYMPDGQPALCCQKLEAIERWINAGAPNN